HQPVHPFVGGGHPHPPGPRQPVGGGVDPRHGHHPEGGGQPHHFDHQVGADVARPEHRHTRTHAPPALPSPAALPGPSPAPPSHCTRTAPSPLIRASYAACGGTGTIGRSAPQSTTSPARSGLPACARVPANHARACSGFPRQAAPAPTDTGRPACSSTMPHVRRSTSDKRTGRVPRTNFPLEALSATVSTIEISQSAIRESTISIAGSRWSTARIRSTVVGWGR